MKKQFNLMYCDSVLTTRVVHYLVMVGVSRRDQCAAAQIARAAASSNNLYFAVNDREGADFIYSVRQSLRTPKVFGEGYNECTMRVVRKNVVDMWKLIRDLPWPLLNSTAIEQRVSPISA